MILNFQKPTITPTTESHSGNRQIVKSVNTIESSTVQTSTKISSRNIASTATSLSRLQRPVDERQQLNQSLIDGAERDKIVGNLTNCEN